MISFSLIIYDYGIGVKINRKSVIAYLRIMATLNSSSVTGAVNVSSAWVNFSGGGSIRNSYNVSSISVYGGGNYGINFSSTLSSGYAYSLSGQERNDSGARPDFIMNAYTYGDPGTSQLRVIVAYHSDFNSWFSPNVATAICY